MEIIYLHLNIFSKLQNKKQKYPNVCVFVIMPRVDVCNQGQRSVWNCRLIGQDNLEIVFKSVLHTGTYK